MNDWYLSPKERVLARLHTSERGLTTHEAKIILDETGENTLKAGIFGTVPRSAGNYPYGCRCDLHDV